MPRDEKTREGRPRSTGPLDPIFKALGVGVEEFADLLKVSRQSVYRWQKKTRMISPYNKLRINRLFLARGLRVPYREAV